MIDLHCHLLPGIDDGPKTQEEALEMARLASKNGIKQAIVTPHIIPGRYDNNLASITTAFTNFNEAVVEAGIPLQLGMAAEVRLDPVIKAMVDSNTLPFLGKLDGFQLLLLEFPHGNIPTGSIEMIQWLIKQKIKPVIAHPERNRAVIRDFEKIVPFIEAGCLLQITAGSLVGVFGNEPKKSAERLLERGWVSVIASDAHNRQTRTPDIEPGRVEAAKIVGEAESWVMVKDRPLEITEEHFA